MLPGGNAVAHRDNADIVNAITLRRVYDAVNSTMLTFRQCHYAQSVYDAARRPCCPPDNADIVNAITPRACMMRPGGHPVVATMLTASMPLRSMRV